MKNQLYESDFYAWTQQQSKFLLTGQWQDLDQENLGEEIAALGKQQRQELRNRLGILIGHLLKWDYQPQLRSKSWKATIREQRDEIIDILESNPSLKPYLEEAIAKGFRQGINLVSCHEFRLHNDVAESFVKRGLSLLPICVLDN